MPPKIKIAKIDTPKFEKVARKVGQNAVAEKKAKLRAEVGHIKEIPSKFANTVMEAKKKLLEGKNVKSSATMNDLEVKTKPAEQKELEKKAQKLGVELTSGVETINEVKGKLSQAQRIKEGQINIEQAHKQQKAKGKKTTLADVEAEEKKRGTVTKITTKTGQTKYIGEIDSMKLEAIIKRSPLNPDLQTKYIQTVDKAIESAEGQRDVIDTVFGDVKKYESFLAMAKSMGIDDPDQFKKKFQDIYKREISPDQFKEQLKTYEQSGDRTKLQEDAAKIEKIRDRADNAENGNEKEGNTDSLGSGAEITPFREFMNALDQNMRNAGVKVNFNVGGTTLVLDFTKVKTDIKKFFEDYTDMVTKYLTSNKKIRLGIKLDDKLIETTGLDVDARDFDRALRTKTKTKIQRLTERKHLAFVIDPILANIKAQLQTIDKKIKEEKAKPNDRRVDQLGLSTIKRRGVSNINRLIDKHRSNFFNTSKVIFVGGKKTLKKKKKKKGKKKTKKHITPRVIYSNHNKIDMIDMSGGVKAAGKAADKAGLEKISDGPDGSTPKAKAKKKYNAEQEQKKQAHKAATKTLGEAGVSKEAQADLGGEKAVELAQASIAVGEAVKKSGIPEGTQKEIQGLFKTAMGEIKPGEGGKAKAEQIKTVMVEAGKALGDMKELDAGTSKNIQEAIKECLSDPTKDVKAEFDLKQVVDGKQVLKPEELKSVLADQLKRARDQGLQSAKDARTDIISLKKAAENLTVATKDQIARNIDAVKEPQLGAMTTGFLKFFGIDPAKISAGLAGVEKKRIEAAGRVGLSEKLPGMKKERDLLTQEMIRGGSVMQDIMKTRMASAKSAAHKDIGEMGREPAYRKTEDAKEKAKIELAALQKMTDVDPSIKKLAVAGLTKEIQVMDAKLNSIDMFGQIKPRPGLEYPNQKPEPIKPAEANINANPVKVKPAKVEPVEVKPAEVKPVEAKPVEAKTNKLALANVDFRIKKPSAVGPSVKKQREQIKKQL